MSPPVHFSPCTCFSLYLMFPLVLDVYPYSCLPCSCLHLSMSPPVYVSTYICLSCLVSPCVCLPLFMSPPIDVSPCQCLPLSMSPPIHVSPCLCLPLSMFPCSCVDSLFHAGPSSVNSSMLSKRVFIDISLTSANTH